MVGGGIYHFHNKDQTMTKLELYRLFRQPMHHPMYTHGVAWPTAQSAKRIADIAYERNLPIAIAALHENRHLIGMTMWQQIPVSHYEPFQPDC